MITSRPLGFLAALTLCLTSAQAAAPAARPEYGDFGLDLSARDPAVKPGDDFYRYATGHWLATHTIPADRTRWGTLDQLGEDADERVRKLIQNLPQQAPAGSI